MLATMDIRDKCNQHMFQLREGHVELDAVAQEIIANIVFSHPRGIRAYTIYYKALLALSFERFNPTLCEPLLDAYIGTIVEDFLYYRFLGRSPTDSSLYAETLFKEVIYSRHVEVGRIFRVIGTVLALLKLSEQAEKYLHGSSWSEVTRRTLALFLRLPACSEIVLNGRTCRNVLNSLRAVSLIESSGFSESVINPLLAEVSCLLAEELWSLWKGMARERAETIKEELYYFTSHPAWWFTRCIDIEEMCDFDESSEELWANGIAVAGPFYLRQEAAATEPRKKLKTGFWCEEDTPAT